MPVTRRVFVSMPIDVDGTDVPQNALKWGIVERIAQHGYAPEIFIRENPYNANALAMGRDWTMRDVDEVARRCIGAAIIGLPRWLSHTDDGERRCPTEYCHYEGAVAYTLGLPTFAVLEEGLERRAFFRGGQLFAFSPVDAGSAWLESSAFESVFQSWLKNLAKRRDVFLGYCSEAAETAAAVHGLLEQEGATVLDWQEFPPGGTILEQIRDAAERCTGGVFLFTKDDELEGDEIELAPRDNVVLEAGFFAHAKGSERVLVLREEGAKMPADFGGNVFASFADRHDMSPIVGKIKKFLEHRL